MAAVTSIMRAQQVLMARLNDAPAPARAHVPALRGADAPVVHARRGALPLGKIGERLQVHRTSVTNIVDKLEADGLVRRVPHAEDRRATLAEITAAGRETAARATAALNAAAFGIDALGNDEQEAVTALLRALRVDAGDFVDGA